MTQKEFGSHQEHIFNAYIKAVIKNEATDAKRDISRRSRQEVAFSQLTQSELARISTTDVYDLDSMTFFVRGDKVTVNDVLLGQALAALSPQRREVILLSYFMDKNDPQIGALLHLDTSTIHYRKRTALRRLKEALEAMEGEGRRDTL